MSPGDGLEHPQVQGIVFTGPVQADMRDLVVNVEDHRLGHEVSLIKKFFSTEINPLILRFLLETVTQSR